MKADETDNLLKKAKFIVEKYYDLGEILHIGELHGGYVNSSFTIQAKKSGHSRRYVLRKYNPATTEQKIQFEHGFVSHLRKNGFDLAAGIVPRVRGDTYVKEQVNVEDRILNVFWAVFEFLKGEDRYSWMDTHLSVEDLESAAKVLARLHLAARNFVSPPGTEQALPRIMDLLPTFRQTYAEYSSNAGRTCFDRSFLENLDDILKTVDQSLIPASDLAGMPLLSIHGDYHQGNLKYEASRVIGVFDFDWAKIDLRLFDLAQALAYFCTCWEGDKDGDLDLANAKLFLSFYNAECESAADPRPLNALEQTYLPLMLKAANLYILHLVIIYFYMTDNPDPEAYLDVFNHVLKAIDWIESHADRIAALC